MATQRIGLIINPIAGMGGSVGLKGTDGDLAITARKLGAGPIAAARASIALSQLAGVGDQLTVLTCSGNMGEDACRSGGMEPTVVANAANAKTTASDTVAATEVILQHDPELLLFVGGDGTARDVFAVAGDRQPLLGVPSGVKMHSAVFAATARAAGEVARRFLLHPDRNSMLNESEIVDREKDGHTLRIYGLVQVPRLSFLVPGAKAAHRSSEPARLAGAIRRVAEIIADDRISLLGPGTTMLALKQNLGFSGTPLGIDAVKDGHCVARDLNEERILQLIETQQARIVVTVVGGQGYLFGRGNQQFSPKVIRAIGTDNIVVVATQDKLSSLPGQQLLIDTGDEDLDRELAGYHPVVVGNARSTLMPVKAASVLE